MIDRQYRPGRLHSDGRMQPAPKSCPKVNLAAPHCSRWNRSGLVDMKGHRSSQRPRRKSANGRRASPTRNVLPRHAARTVSLRSTYCRSRRPRLAEPAPSLARGRHRRTPRSKVRHRRKEEEQISINPAISSEPIAHTAQNICTKFG